MGSSFNPAVPTLSDLLSYRTVQPGEAEVIKQSLYDSLLYPAIGTNLLSFFAQPVGVGQSTHPGAVAGTAKSLADTNMELQSQIPRFKNQLVESIEIAFDPGSTPGGAVYQTGLIASAAAAAIATADIADVQDRVAFYNSGSLEFTIAAKNVLTESPLRRFPPKVQERVYGAVGVANPAANNAAALTAVMEGRPYYLDVPTTLFDSASFQLNLRWPNLVPLPSTFPARVRAILDGYQYRAQQ